jgi:hypothetical protein
MRRKKYQQVVDYADTINSPKIADEVNAVVAKSILPAVAVRQGPAQAGEDEQQRIRFQMMLTFT